MSHVARCLHCNHDLSNAPRSGAAALRCPNCGAQQLTPRTTAGTPPRPPVRATPAGAASPRPAPAAGASPRAGTVAGIGARPVPSPSPAQAAPVRPPLPARPAPARPAPARPPLPERPAVVASPAASPLVSKVEAPPKPAVNPFLPESPAVAPAQPAAPVQDIPVQVSEPAPLAVATAVATAVTSPVVSSPQVTNVPVAVGLPAQSAPVTAPRAVAVEAVPFSSGLQAQPGALSPQVRDAHAEFRRGNWQKPAVLLAVAAVALAGLFFFLPGEDAAVAKTESPVSQRSTPATIGGSLAPDRTVDDQQELVGHKERFEQQAQPEAKEAPQAPSGITAERDFGKAFKAAASR